MYAVLHTAGMLLVNAGDLTRWFMFTYSVRATLSMRIPSRYPKKDVSVSLNDRIPSECDMPRAQPASCSVHRAQSCASAQLSVSKSHNLMGQRSDKNEERSSAGLTF